MLVGPGVLAVLGISNVIGLYCISKKCIGALSISNPDPDSLSSVTRELRRCSDDI